VSQHRYLDPDTLEAIKRLGVRARMVVEGFLAGLHESPYHGYAVEFASHREYAPGDELKHIDWKVWSKTDRLFIKQYEEETNLHCTLVLDASRSMHYGGGRPGLDKFTYAATAAAALAYLLLRQQDSVGLVTFHHAVRSVLPASSRPGQAETLIQQLEDLTPDSTTDVGGVFAEIAPQIRRRGMVVLISDLFVDRDSLAAALGRLRAEGRDVIVLHVMHRDELEFPFQRNTLFRGLEIERRLHTDPRSLRRSYLAAVERFTTRVREICHGAGADYELMSTAEPLSATLARVLAFRGKVRGKRRGAAT